MRMRPKQFSKINARINEMMDGGINPFIYYTNRKKKRNLKWYLEYREFTKYLGAVSPSFKLLWCIASYIHMIELVYMYQNTEDADIYSYTLAKSNVQSFRITYPTFFIEYTLYEEDHIINININRFWSKESVSTITFPDGHATMETRPDEILMFNIIEWTMNPIKKLFTHYYKDIATEVK